MNNILKNRTVIGIVCIVLSLIICFGLTPLFNNTLKAQTEIIRITKDIKKGEIITEKDIEIVKVGGYNLPETVMKSLDDLKGKYTLADFMKGDYILASKLTDVPPKENDYLYNLDGSKTAISISIKSFALGLSGKLQSGDIVSIIASDYGEMRETLIPTELKYVEVLAVTNSKGFDGETDPISCKTAKEDDVELPSAVTLLANTTQAELLAELETKSKIHIALVYRGDETTSKKFLVVQEEAIKAMEAIPDEQENTEVSEFAPIEQTKSFQTNKDFHNKQEDAYQTSEPIPAVQDTTESTGGRSDE